MTLTREQNRQLDFMAMSVIKRNRYEHGRRLYKAKNMPPREAVRSRIAYEKWLRFTQDLHHFPLEMFAGVGVRGLL